MREYFQALLLGLLSLAVVFFSSYNALAVAVDGGSVEVGTVTEASSEENSNKPEPGQSDVGNEVPQGSEADEGSETTEGDKVDDASKDNDQGTGDVNSIPDKETEDSPVSENENSDGQGDGQQDEDTFGKELPEDNPYLDSGVPPDQPTMEENISAIRRDLDVLLYGVLPLSIIILVFYLGCRWFKHTFIDSAL